MIMITVMITSATTLITITVTSTMTVVKIVSSASTTATTKYQIVPKSITISRMSKIIIPSHRYDFLL
ncbi:TPA: hypothetical protein QCQ44_004866 [Bacillus cereus]|nr:hypothetical protein [Bacillus cereus]